jgi:hypothetical protein
MKTIQTKHELDSMFDIEPGQTNVSIPGKEIAEVIDVEGLVEETDDQAGLSAVDSYDEKDNEIEGQVNDVFERAIEAHETQMVNAQTVTDKKFAPRNAEVAADFLRIALEALKEKNSIKDRKDKLATKVPRGRHQSSITNNIVTDRNTMMRLMREQRSKNQ